MDGDVAKLLKFRPQAIKKLSLEQRARHARNLLLARRNAEMTYEIFGAYLLRNHKELVTGFLDALGVAHKDGMIEDMAAARPDEAKIAGALAALDPKHKPEDVTLYLALCAQHWPESRQIAELWKARAGQAAAST
jgi:hypothetical protein